MKIKFKCKKLKIKIKNDLCTYKYATEGLKLINIMIYRNF